MKLQVLPSSALVKEGDDVKLVCEADGNPAPVFSFFKRGVRPEGTWAPPRVLAPCPLPEGPGEQDAVAGVGDACVGLRALLASRCLQMDDVWHDLSSLTDTSSGVLNLHDVNKNSSGLYRCQTLDLDDMRQLEKDVELVVNCKAGERDPVDLLLGVSSLQLTLPWSPSLS